MLKVEGRCCTRRPSSKACTCKCPFKSQ